MFIVIYSPQFPCQVRHKIYPSPPVSWPKGKSKIRSVSLSLLLSCSLLLSRIVVDFIVSVELIGFIVLHCGCAGRAGRRVQSVLCSVPGPVPGLLLAILLSN